MALLSGIVWFPVRLFSPVKGHSNNTLHLRGEGEVTK